MICYITDGTFDGLLSAISRSLARDDIETIVDHDEERNLFADYLTIPADETISRSLLKRIESTMSPDSLSHIICAYLSESPGAYDAIRRYVRFGLTTGKKTDLHLSHDPVRAVHRLSQKVRHESHRMLGLVRFELVEQGLYYARIDPDHNIISMIAPHFRSRMGSQPWIIHDEKRNLAAINSSQRITYTSIDLERQPELSQEELEYQRLWKNYFKSIAITERKNPRLQRQFLPERYWKNLTEMG